LKDLISVRDVHVDLTMPSTRFRKINKIREWRKTKI